MKNSFKLLWKLIAVFLVLSYSACRKTDQPAIQLQKETPQTPAIDDRVFNTNRTADPAEKHLVEFIKKENNKEHFVKNIEGKISFPRWDYAVATKTILLAGEIPIHLI